MEKVAFDIKRSSTGLIELIIDLGQNNLRRLIVFSKGWATLLVAYILEVGGTDRDPLMNMSDKLLFVEPVSTRKARCDWAGRGESAWLKIRHRVGRGKIEINECEPVAPIPDGLQSCPTCVRLNSGEFDEQPECNHTAVDGSLIDVLLPGPMANPAVISIPDNERAEKSGYPVLQVPPKIIVLLYCRHEAFEPAIYP